MKTLVSVLIVSMVSAGLIAYSGDQAEKEKSVSQEKHLANIRQLTFGGENAEAYFSPDGKRLIFQSTRDGYPCDQIYVMNVDGGNIHRVSTGKGRTTCGYFFYPKGQRILYSSTHLADEDCPPPPDPAQGYVWKLYPAYDIFSAKPDGSDLRRLTDAEGYDAEATVAAKGRKIVFTSTRDGDPELYTMNLDGSDQKRLTYAPGYDGGAFYSADCKKIVFRANRPETPEELADYQMLIKDGLIRPMRLELFIMDADGSNLRQVTNNGAANFAPYFHPNGKQIIFASNVHNPRGRNFDLYLINVDGTGLEQITFNETFDGFPMFSQDGKRLVFASNRNAKTPGETNIFIADWVP